jgi:hypothetical protein
MMGVFIRLTQVGALGVVAALAAGCAADPAAEAAPTADAAATTLATPDAGALQEAEYTEQDKTAEDEAAVQRTVERYYELIVPSAKSWNALQERRALYGAGCSPCEGGAAAAQSILEDGLELKGAHLGYSINRISVRGRTATAIAKVSMTASRLVTPDGQTVSRLPASQFVDRWLLRRQPSGQWLIVQGSL